jgi:hypothetical protein
MLGVRLFIRLHKFVADVAAQAGLHLGTCC